MMTFEELNLATPILSALAACAHTTPTAIQTQAIPVVMQGRDLLATSQTGTGKTAAFVLPSLHRLTNFEKSPNPKILILTPTRELATQISMAVNEYGKHLRVKVVNILCGMPYPTQLRQLAKPSDIIIATPGRLIDHIERGKINLSEIKIFILDEADRMLDMGFYEDVEYIAAQLPKEKQILLFTATIDARLMKLSKKLLHNPEQIEVVGKRVTLDNIKQQVYMANSVQHKTKLLRDILADKEATKVIVFTATKRTAETLTEELLESGYGAGALHGDMHQRKRNKTMSRLHSGKISLLIATDIASRGIDVDNVTHVINYDLPRTSEDYVHRIGRTGRIGRAGTSISFVKTNDMALLKKIEKFTQQKIEKKGFSEEDASTSSPTKKKVNKDFSKKWSSQKKKHGVRFEKSDTKEPRFSKNKKHGAARRGTDHKKQSWGKRF